MRSKARAGKVELADLFGDKQTLAVYSYMFGPQREQPCPIVHLLHERVGAKLPDIEQRIAFVFVARSPIARLIEAKKARGWTRHKIYLRSIRRLHARLCQRRGCGRARLQRIHAARRHHPPFLVRRDGRATMADPGQDPRGAPDIDPLWTMLDTTPEGRGTNWYPKLSY